MFQVELRNKVFPLKLEWLIFALPLLGLLNAIGYAPFNDLLNNTATYIEAFTGSFVISRLIATLIFGSLIVPLTVVLVRFAFTLLLYYHGWLFEEVGKPPSLQTKIFITILQFVNKYATFLSFSDICPWMLIPSLDSTIENHLKTVRPILNDEEYARVCDEAEVFKTTLGPVLQRKLWLKWLTSRNYISDWWKELVYMRHRGSLIRTNVACADVIYQKTSHIQAARAAVVTLLRLQFLEEMFETQTNFKPITIGGIPLCPSQYLDYYRSLRVPGKTSDKFMRLPDATHIAVYCKGCWYKVEVVVGGNFLKAAELEMILQNIIDREPDSANGEAKLGALTAGPRDLWARIRDEKFKDGVNRESLSAIENALEVIFLDDQETGYSETNPDLYDREYARALHGDGYALWCDKPSVYIFASNGRFMSNAEHSAVDAMTLVHIREFVKYHEHVNKPYSEDGHCRGEVRQNIPTPQRLQFDLDSETVDAVSTAFAYSSEIAGDLDNSSVVFTDFGKNFIKKVKVSPDAFLQMAIQMAYFEDQGRFDLTYEPAVMRLFKDGRTETVRSCSIDSCAFVRALRDPKVTDSEKITLLRKACAAHQNYVRMAMAGKASDRHLFGLYVVAKYLEKPSDFLDSVFGMNYILSTSQTPQHQMPEYSPLLNKEESLFWPAGAFTCPEGSKYGVCYTISGPGTAFSFHVSTWHSIEGTDAKRFAKRITTALRDLKALADRSI
uniref:Carn_acyltransf domain-containing protein n=1 Tax=Panagrellus redivivus TaxID=6233 RepID=A0A7E4V0A4_PANRE